MLNQQIFRLIEYLLMQRNNLPNLQSALYLINLVIHMLIYFSFDNIGLLNIDSIFNSLKLLLALLAIMGSLLLEVFVYMVRQKQAFLLVQLSIFRFIAIPLLLFTVLTLCNSSSINSYLGYFIFMLAQTLSDGMCRTFLFQIHRVRSLNIKQPSVVQQMSKFQIILICSHFVSDIRNLHLFSLVMLMAALNTTFCHFYKIQSNNIEYKTLSFVNFVHVTMSLVLLYQLVIPSNSSNLYIAILFVALVYYAATAFMRKRASADDLGRILAQGIQFEEFISEVDFFLSLLIETQGSTQLKGQFKNYLASVVSQHRKNCGMPNCELETDRTLKEITTLNTKQIGLVSVKVLKKIEWIIQQYHMQDAANIRFRFILLKLYAYYLPNRLKIQHLIDQKVSEGEQLTWQHQCELYQYRRICDRMESTQNIDPIQVDDDFLKFQNALLATIHYMTEFWSKFSEEKVDLNRIMSISSKLCPFKIKVQQIAQQQLKIQKFTSYKILCLYSQYLKLVLNKYELAYKIQEYLMILIERLRDKQDIKYLSRESENGFIIISLTDTKMGDIFLANQKACTIFKYTKTQFLTRKVNDIMPGVFANMHDKILKEFLKTKSSHFNTDERVLFGKDGNGYLFPLMLQLQKASFTANDEYIFIAAVRPQKTKSAPIYCIVDHEGLIYEYTTSFKRIFFRSKSRKAFRKNIQEIIPEYFDQQDYEDYAQIIKKTRYFSSVIRNKKLEEIEVTFVVSPIVIKAIHEGFLVKMVYNNQNISENPKYQNFTDILTKALNRNQLYACENYYQPSYSLFQIQTGQTRLLSNQNKDSEMMRSLMGGRGSAVVIQPTKNKNYGGSIRTIRLTHNHYERIQDQSSFHSEVYSNQQKMDIRTKIDEIRSKFTKKQQKFAVNIFKATILILLISICGILINCYLLYQNESMEENTFLLSYDYQMRLKYILPQFIIYFTMASAGINAPYYQQKMSVRQPTLTDSVVNAQIDELRKEDILKITYLQQQMTIKLLLDTSTIQYIQTDSTIQTSLLLSWAAVIAGTFALILVHIFIVYYFKSILFRVYTLFLAVKQSSVRRIYDSCKAFKHKIQHESGISQQEQPKSQSIVGGEDQNSIQKIKQFKNVSRRQDKVYLAELILPLVFLAAFCLVVMMVGYQSFLSYSAIKNYHNNMYESIPAISIEFMKTILQIFKGQNITLDNQYALHYQELLGLIWQFQNASQTFKYQNIMHGNACRNSQVITPDQLSDCSTIANGILTYGVASSLNYVVQNIKNIQQTNSYHLSNIQTLIKLQFNFINPVLQNIEDTMADFLVQTVSSLDANCQLFTSLIILAYILYICYLVLYPIRNIQSQLDFTNGMINLIPENAAQTSPTP